MTTAEKNALKMQALDDCIALLRHTVRHNGAAITAKADISEVADHVLDFNTDRVKTLWTDINTIDRVKQILYMRGWMKSLTNRVLPRELLSMSAEELLEYAVNDERLTAGTHSWAVVKITKKGTEILTCGGNFYQAYKKSERTTLIPATDMTAIEDATVYGLEGAGYFLLDGLSLTVGESYDVVINNVFFEVPLGESETYTAYGSYANSQGNTAHLIVKDGNTFMQYVDSSGGTLTTANIRIDHLTETITQEGDTDLLAAALNEEDAAWMAEIFESDIHGYPSYMESGEEFIQIPCELPGDLSQLISIAVTRTKIEDGTEATPLEYSLTENSCDTSNEGMVELPHGMWLIYDNTNLESAPQALLIPKELAEGKDTGFRFNKVKIAYNSLVSGMERLRLVGDSFGDEYIVSVIDLDYDLGGTWKE